MKGYIYLTVEDTLEVRNKDFIDTEDPGFLGRTKHLIVSLWEFDTDNDDLMVEVIRAISRHQLKTEVVQNAFGAMSFDIEALKARRKKA